MAKLAEIEVGPKATPVDGVYLLDMPLGDLGDMDGDSLVFPSAWGDASGNPLPRAGSLKALERQVGTKGLAALKDFFQSELGLPWNLTAAEVLASLLDDIRKLAAAPYESFRKSMVSFKAQIGKMSFSLPQGVPPILDRNHLPVGPPVQEPPIIQQMAEMQREIEMAPSLLAEVEDRLARIDKSMEEARDQSRQMFKVQRQTFWLQVWVFWVAVPPSVICALEALPRGWGGWVTQVFMEGAALALRHVLGSG